MAAKGARKTRLSLYMSDWSCRAGALAHGFWVQIMDGEVRSNHTSAEHGPPSCQVSHPMETSAHPSAPL